MDLPPGFGKTSVDQWDHKVFREKDIRVDVLRLDKIHPEISGNKWFKLQYYLQQARQEKKTKLVSFGGAYSNHLIALAETCRLYGFSSSAFIRGEEPVKWSHTLKSVKDKGMELHFLSRQDYQDLKKRVLAGEFENEESDELFVQEGGAGKKGIQGAEEILPQIPYLHYSHICSAAGTGTTLAGVTNSAGSQQKIVGVSVLRGTKNIEPLQESWLNKPACVHQVEMIHEYHFGGYAKYSKTLLDFMNEVYSETGIPTDFVYTGKLFYAVVQLASGNKFPGGSQILVLHTGGLQGNLSLPQGILAF
jgi:1-aminocyclopropane-1-carboxylate deaminase/D-cysteine desulfhydrase-like pyridoxal-dependent ACC family enzyme